MTPADIVAEALAHAEKVTPDDRDDKPRFAVWLAGSVPYHVSKADLLDLDPSGEAVVVRDDVAVAALAHVAERLVKERERAFEAGLQAAAGVLRDTWMEMDERHEPTTIGLLKTLAEAIEEVEVPRG